MTEQRDEARIELEKYTTDSEDDALYNVRRLRKELTAATEQLDELARQNKLFRNETLIWVDCDAVRKDEYNTVIQQLDEAREALRDMLSGWRYIRKTHGDLYGVGWDRAQNKAEQALQSLTPNEP
jgi:flagellar biosynthesis chaperone FliJ